MQELYGKLNTVTQQINYSGGSTDTATVAVDNKIKKLTTNVLRVPQSLTIKRKNQEDELFDGSNATTIDLTDTALSNDLPTVIDLTQYTPGPEPEPVDELPYIMDGSTLAKYLGTELYVTLPLSYSLINGRVVEGNDYFLTKIGVGAFANNENIVTVNIPEGYTQISPQAFRGCSNLQEVTLPESLTTILAFAFGDCISLDNVVVPSQITDLYSGIFSGDSNLLSLTFLNEDSMVNISDNALTGTSQELVISVPYAFIQDYQNTYPQYNFVAYDAPVGIQLPYTLIERNGEYYIESYIGSESIITLPTTCSIIDGQVVEGYDYTIVGTGARAFAYNSMILDVEIPEGYNSLGAYTFEGCVNLQYVSIPSSLSMITKGSFSGCTSLTDIVLPNVRHIGLDAFSNCQNLSTILVEYTEGIITIDSPETSIPQSTVIYVPSVLLDGYQNTYPGLTFEGYGDEPVGESLPFTFSGNVLTGYTGNDSDIIIPSSYAIGETHTENANTSFDYTQEGQQIMEELSCTLEQAQEEVQSRYLRDDLTFFLEGLQEIVIQDVWSAVDELLMNIDMDVQLDDNITGRIDRVNFQYSVNITQEVVEYIEGDDYTVDIIGPNSFEGNQDITSVSIPDTVTYIDNAAFYGCSNLVSVSIPDNVTYIGQGAFSDCSSLYDITLPSMLETLDYGALSSTAITSIVVPDSVTSLGERVFENCRELTSVTLPQGITVLPSCLFLFCTSLSFTIPDTVVEIEQGALRGCVSITSLTVPGSVEIIGRQAFADSGLTSVYLNSLTVVSLGENVFGNIEQNVTVYVPQALLAEYQSTYPNLTFVAMNE